MTTIFALTAGVAFGLTILLIVHVVFGDRDAPVVRWCMTHYLGGFALFVLAPLVTFWTGALFTIAALGV